MPSLVLDALSRILRLLITRSSVQITHPRSINPNCALRETQFNYAPLSGGLGCVFRGSGLHCALKGHFLYYALVNSTLPLGTPTIVYFNLRMTLNYDKSKALCSQHTLGMPFRIAHHYALSNLDYIAHFQLFTKGTPLRLHISLKVHQPLHTTKCAKMAHYTSPTCIVLIEQTTINVLLIHQ